LYNNKSAAFSLLKTNPTLSTKQNVSVSFPRATCVDVSFSHLYLLFSFLFSGGEKLARSVGVITLIATKAQQQQQQLERDGDHLKEDARAQKRRKLNEEGQAESIKDTKNENDERRQEQRVLWDLELLWGHSASQSFGVGYCYQPSPSSPSEIKSFVSPPLNSTSSSSSSSFLSQPKPRTSTTTSSSSSSLSTIVSGRFFSAFS
jgi:hypothetical protein